MIPSFGGLNPIFLLNLVLVFFGVWKISNTIVTYKGHSHFLALFLGSGLVASMSALPLISHNDHLILAGPSPAIFAMMIALMFLYSELQIMLLITTSLKFKWIIICILGSILLIDLSNRSFVSFVANISGLIYGYLFSVIVWKLNGPFTFLHRLENLLIRTRAIVSRDKETLESYASQDSKIYDFKTGRKILADEEFVDACLSKITKEGKNSLTFFEKHRLSKISRKKRKAKETTSNA